MPLPLRPEPLKEPLAPLGHKLAGTRPAVARGDPVAVAVSLYGLSGEWVLLRLGSVW